MPSCPLGFLCESGDLAVRLQLLHAIELEVPAQVNAFLNKLFYLVIHPGDLTFVDRLVGGGTALALFCRLQKASKCLDRDPTDDTVWISLSEHLLERSQSALE